MDFKVLWERLGIDQEDFMELVELFVITSLSDIEKIKTGMAGNNPDDAAAASHSIKGAAGNLGFDEISNLAKDMEMQAKSGSLENFDAYVNDLENSVNALNSP
jgi:HPt (histidine-containing phosphotransfer) domain-containing protein